MRNKKHNPKIPIILGVALFIGISVVVINAKDMQTISRVKVSNQQIVINQGNTGISNTDVGFNNSGNLSNQNTNIGNQGNFSNTGGGVNNTGNFNNQNTGFGNQGELSNTGGGVNNTGNFNNQNTGFGNQSGLNNTGGSFNNQGGSFNNENGDIGSYNVGFGNKDYRSDMNKYKYQDIDWSTWKSNFVNRILDDSMYIKSLDLYGMGTWFYYSFNVTDKGEIKDVFVFSIYLNDEDKKQIRDLIRSYAHQPITIFPKDSRRKKAKVKAIMLLGDTESKSDASNFNDIEKIKIKY
ncbi:hypothetical protein J6O86_06770 [bacterium]|nr:hypothetical protein [bacterium]